MTEHELIWQIQFLEDGRDALADLVAHLERAPLFDVPSHSGETTWQGPTPDVFNDTLTLQVGKLNDVIDELRTYGSYLPDRIWALERDLADLRAAREAAIAAAATE